MSPRKKLTFAQKTCLSQAGKLMYHTRMLWPGARVGVAVSGGMDSFVLLKVLSLYIRRLPFPVEIMALHINPGFDTGLHRPLVDWSAANGIAGHFENSDMGPRAHSPENRKNSPCFHCSWFRRKRLFDLCKWYRLSHLALGHTAEDLVTTFFMNILQSGRVEGMLPRAEYFGGEFELVRPLLMVEKKSIAAACRQWGLPIWTNPCPSASVSRRADIRGWMEQLWSHDKESRRKTYNALIRWQLDFKR